MCLLSNMRETHLLSNTRFELRLYANYLLSFIFKEATNQNVKNRLKYWLHSA